MSPHHTWFAALTPLSLCTPSYTLCIYLIYIVHAILPGWNPVLMDFQVSFNLKQRQRVVTGPPYFLSLRKVYLNLEGETQTKEKKQTVVVPFQSLKILFNLLCHSFIKASGLLFKYFWPVWFYSGMWDYEVISLKRWGMMHPHSSICFVYCATVATCHSGEEEDVAPRDYQKLLRSRTSPASQHQTHGWAPVMTRATPCSSEHQKEQVFDSCQPQSRWTQWIPFSLKNDLITH